MGAQRSTSAAPGSAGNPARWPHIARYLRVRSSGWVDHDFHSWCGSRKRLSPAERAAGDEEWADFFEWRLTQRADELAGDRAKRRLVETWTDSMAHLSRRSAARARGEDPGRWVPQHVRRPDLDGCPDPPGQPATTG